MQAMQATETQPAKETPKPETSEASEVSEFGNLPEPHPCRPKNIPLSKIVELRNKNLSHNQIGALLGCTGKAIQQRLKRFPELDSGAAQEYKDARSDILRALQIRTLKTLSKEDIEKTSVRDRTILFGTLYDKERLEEDKTTANVTSWIRVIDDSPVQVIDIPQDVVDVDNSEIASDE